MLLRLALLQVLALVVSTTPIDGAATPPRVCPLKLDEGQPMSIAIDMMSIHCLPTNLDQLKELSTPEEHTALFKDVCEKKGQFRECLADVEQTAALCLDESQHRIFQLFRDLLHTTLDSVCVRDGEDLAYLVTAYKASSSSPFESDPLRDCIATNLGSVMVDKDLSTSSRFFVLYVEVKNFRECINAIDEGDNNTLTNAKSILTEITNNMKCAHPLDGTAVLCKTLDVTLSDVPRVCPIKLQNEAESSLDNVLVDRLDWCVAAAYYLQEGSWDNITSLDLSRAYVKHYCAKQEIVARCSSELVALASVCLNETQHNLIKVVDDLVQNVFDQACIEKGRPFAHVLFKVLSEKNDTADSNGVFRECIDIADRVVEGGNMDLGAARILAYYQQFTVFKGCFVEKMRGDNVAVLNARGFINAVQSNMKCVDPEHEKIVRCETIDTTPHTETTVCPLVGEHEGEQPTYEMLVDRGFTCITTSRVDFDGIDDFTTVEEFSSFFATFCGNRQAVQHCVDDLSSLSAICQNQTNHQMLSIFTDFLGTTLATGCRRDGEVLATIVHGLVTSDAIDRDQMESCLGAIRDQSKDKSLSVDALSARSVAAFRAFESMKECFTNGLPESNSFKSAFISFVNEMLRALKCVHPDDGSTVLCETIVNS